MPQTVALSYGETEESDSEGDPFAGSDEESREEEDGTSLRRQKAQVVRMNAPKRRPKALVKKIASADKNRVNVLCS